MDYCHSNIILLYVISWYIYIYSIHFTHRHILYWITRLDDIYIYIYKSLLFEHPNLSMTGGLCRMWSVPRGLLHGLGGAGGPWDIHTWWYNSQWYVSQGYIRGKIGWGRFVRSYKPVRMGCPSAPTLRQGFSRENYDKSWGHIEFLRHAHSNSQTSWHSGDSSMPNVLNQTLFWDHEGKGLTHVCLKHKHKLTGCHSLPWCIYVFFPVQSAWGAG